MLITRTKSIFKVTNVNWIYYGDHFAIYTNGKSCCTPETNKTLCVNYTSIFKKANCPHISEGWLCCYFKEHCVFLACWLEVAGGSLTPPLLKLCLHSFLFPSPLYWPLLGTERQYWGCNVDGSCWAKMQGAQGGPLPQLRSSERP